MHLFMQNVIVNTSFFLSITGYYHIALIEASRKGLYSKHIMVPEVTSLNWF